MKRIFAESKDLADVLDHVSGAITAVVAVAALLYAHKQIEAAREVQREATARAAYNDYLKLAIEKPNYANGVPLLVEVNQKAKEGPVASAGDKSKTEENEKSPEAKYREYQWFVSYFLGVAEQIHELDPTDKIWNKTITDQIRLHKDYLSCNEFLDKEGGHYSESFAKLLRKALSKKETEINTSNCETYKRFDRRP